MSAIGTAKTTRNHASGESEYGYSNQIPQILHGQWNFSEPDFGILLAPRYYKLFHH